VITQLPQVKLRLPELDVNGRLDRRDDLRLSKGHTESAEKRADHAAVTLRLDSVCQQQTRLDALLSYNCSHTKTSLYANSNRFGADMLSSASLSPRCAASRLP
jgi:hypothetical protein